MIEVKQVKLGQSPLARRFGEDAEVEVKVTGK